MEEIWKDVDGYEGYYQVSSFGRVRSLDRVVNKRLYKGRVLCLPNDSDGYKIVGLYKDGHTMAKVHRLVAKAFIPNPKNLPEVNHKDENKENNFVSNLEWCTTKYNLTYGHRLDCARGERNTKSKLTKDQILEIREIYIKGDLEFGQSALSRRYGVKHPTIAAIVKRKSWKHI